jgi:hypothetical protein
MGRGVTLTPLFCHACILSANASNSLHYYLRASKTLKNLFCKWLNINVLQNRGGRFYKRLQMNNLHK